MKDDGPVHHFLGIEVQWSANTLHLSQTHYARIILGKAHMLDSNPLNTPIESKTKGFMITLTSLILVFTIALLVLYNI